MSQIGQVGLINPQNNAQSPSSEIMSEIMMLDSDINILEELLGDMDIRLSPIMRPSPPEEQLNTPIIKEPLTEVGEAIRMRTVRVHNLGLVVRNLLARIAV